MHRAKPKTPLSIMEKKIPVNPKYASTQSKVDSGTTVHKVRLISNKEFLKRLDETFRRVTPRNLEELLAEYEDNGGSCSSQPEMVAKMVKKSDGKFVMERVPADDNNNQSSNSGGPRIVSYEAEEAEEYDPPYLILDTRTKEEFAVNRVQRAKNFPASYLNRDVLLPEMHRFKNQESKLIVIYDQDEKTAPQTAHTLVQRGFDNIYVLTGGLVDFADEFPDRVEGMPLPKKPVDPSKKTVTKEVYRNGSALSTTGPKSVKSAATAASRKKADGASDVSSVMSSLSVADSVITRANARKARVVTGANYR